MICLPICVRVITPASKSHQLHVVKPLLHLLGNVEPFISRARVTTLSVPPAPNSINHAANCSRYSAL